MTTEKHNSKQPDYLGHCNLVADVQGVEEGPDGEKVMAMVFLINVKL